MKNYLLWMFAAFFFLSELILMKNSLAGVVCYAVLLTACLILLSRQKEMNNGGALLSVLLIFPVMRVVERFINIGLFWNTLIFYNLLLFLGVFYCFKLKISLGYKKNSIWIYFLAVILAGLTGYLGRQILNLDKSLLILALIPVIAFSEEILFRGLMQNLTKKTYGNFISILFTSLLYGIFSMSYGVPAIIFLFSASVVISSIYNFTESIYPAVLMNLALHFLIFA